MYRSDWELAIYAQQHIAQLGDEQRADSQSGQVNSGATSPLTAFRRQLGIGLIQAGQRLAGSDGVRALPTSPARPAMGRSGS